VSLNIYSVIQAYSNSYVLLLISSLAITVLKEHLKLNHRAEA